MTIEMKYYTYYLPKVFAGARPLLESIIALSSIVLYTVGSYLAIKAGYSRTLIYGMLLPGRVAVALLAFFFDYLPHRPHAVSRAANEYVATGVATLYGDWAAPLTMPLLYQNYHIIHHLAPYVPFYHYSKLWYTYKDKLIELGTSTKPLFGLNDSAVTAVCSLGDAQKSVASKKRM
jgi:fatty acid desaturase